MTVIHLFRRDYRLVDNTALNEALKTGKEVLPIFIFDPRQQREQNEYFAEHSFRFLVKSLEELDAALKEKESKLHIYKEDPQNILEFLIKEKDVSAVYVNADYTPFSKKRDEQLKAICEKHKVQWHSYEDALLHPIDIIKNQEGKPYRVFTPFYKEGMKHDIAAPHTESGTFRRIRDDYQINFEDITIDNELEMAVQPGRKAAINILESLADYQNYSKTRDFPIKDATTHLSAHHKFGTVSVREVAYFIMEALGREHALLRQLYWREFYYAISHHFPKVYGHAFNPSFEEVEWENNEEKFNRWKEGKTGFPLVDAGMRELVQTGYMHNRVRMVVASFLTKDLHIDWRWGERFFAQYLLDYDPAQNNGNWQWSASTGADGAPYFRIFSPWRQQERFDPDCEYIKKWISELRDLEAKAIHNMEKNRPLGLSDSDYPKPIVNHKEEADKAKTYYKVSKESYHS
jgi:deoxyribodipyrimidine photo-lyase